MSDSPHPKFHWSTVWQMLQKFGALLTVAAIAIFGFWGGHFLLPGEQHSAEDHSAQEDNAEVGKESDATPTVTLPKEKFDNANLAVAQVEAAQFQAHKAIPGVINFDATRKVELRATVASVVNEALVRPNQFVKLGDPLLILTGPEIGVARGEVSRYEAELALLKKEHSWIVETHGNIEELLELLKKSPTTDEVNARFDNKKLGEHRNDILSAYSDLQLAKQLSNRTQRLLKQGAISGKTAQERSSGGDVAAAKFNSIREEMSFQITQQLAQSQAKLEAAKKRLMNCKQNLSSMLGANADLSNRRETEIKKSASEFVLKAPRSGQIVFLPAVTSARFEPGEVVAEIADTSEVWVEAQVSQQDWHSLNLENGQSLSVRMPAIPDRKFSAKVRHISASVSKDTMAIPIVAALENEDGKFRPGMSVWVEVPMSEARRSIVVPTGAVQRKGDEAFVFVKTGERSFEKRDVELGAESASQFEIVSGLSESDSVVVEGSFYLKSEWLLAEEEE